MKDLLKSTEAIVVLGVLGGILVMGPRIDYILAVGGIVAYVLLNVPAAWSKVKSWFN